MPKKETVRALVDAFNVNNYARGIIKTNFKLQNRNNEECIIISLDKGMGNYQCEEYLHDVKRKMVHEFYDVEKNRCEMAGIVKLIFNVASFLFNVSEEG
jgi:nucleoside diphosphate kinase